MPCAPGHFDGVNQVLAKLFNEAQADVAVFGEKDWQQFVVVRCMARDLDIPTNILGAPTVREDDGLAMSSRNRCLTAQERTIASILPKTMRAMTKVYLAGQDIDALQENGAKTLIDAGFQSVDYLEFRTADDLAPVVVLDPSAPTRPFAAAHLGKAPLIDNLARRATD